MKEHRMLIIELMLTETGMNLVDADGGALHFSAEDALELCKWIEQHRDELTLMVQQQEHS